MADEDEGKKRVSSKRDAFSAVGRANSAKQISRQKIGTQERKPVTLDDTAAGKKKLDDNDPLARKAKKAVEGDPLAPKKPKKDGKEPKDPSKPKKDKKPGDEAAGDKATKRLSRTSVSDESSDTESDSKTKTKAVVPEAIPESDETSDHHAKHKKSEERKSSRKSASLKTKDIVTAETLVAGAVDAHAPETHKPAEPDATGDRNSRRKSASLKGKDAVDALPAVHAETHSDTPAGALNLSAPSGMAKLSPRVSVGAASPRPGISPRSASPAVVSPRVDSPSPARVSPRAGVEPVALPPPPSVDQASLPAALNLPPPPTDVDVVPLGQDALATEPVTLPPPVVAQDTPVVATPAPELTPAPASLALPAEPVRQPSPGRLAALADRSSDGTPPPPPEDPSDEPPPPPADTGDEPPPPPEDTDEVVPPPPPEDSIPGDDTSLSDSSLSISTEQLTAGSSDSLPLPQFTTTDPSGAPVPMLPPGVGKPNTPRKEGDPVGSTKAPNKVRRESSIPDAAASRRPGPKRKDSSKEKEDFAVGDSAKQAGRERSGTRDETAEGKLHHLKTAATRERSSTRDEGRNKPKLPGNTDGTDSAASSDNEDDTGSNDGDKKKKVKKSKSRSTLRGSISRQAGTEVKAQLAAMGIGPDTPAAAPAAPEPLPEGVPPPPPPPGKSTVSKDKLLETEHTRKVLTRLVTPKAIDEELKKWDKKIVNFEDIWTSKQLVEDPLHREIFIFPSNDVYLETVKRNVGTLPTPDKDTPNFVKDSLEFFTGDLKHVKYASERYGGRVTLQQRIKEKEERDIRLKTLQERAEKAEKDDVKKKKKKGSLVPSADSKPSTLRTASPTPSPKKPRGSVGVTDSPRASLVIAEPAGPSPSVKEAPPSPKLSASDTASLKLPAKPDTGSLSPKSPVNKKSLDLSGKVRRGSNVGIPEDDDSSDSSSKSSASGAASPAAPIVLHEPLLNIDENIQQIMRTKRLQHMSGVFDTFTAPSINSEPTETRTRVAPLTKTYGTRVLLHAKNLNIQNGVEDAFYFTLCIYDIQKKLRLSEDFYFDFNDQNELIKALVAGQTGGSKNDPEAHAKHALLNFTTTNENIYLVVRAATILKGDIDTIAENYTQGHSISAASRQKWIDTNRQAASLLGKYRQSFAWAATPVFDASNNLLLTRDFKLNFYKMKTPIDDVALYDVLNSEEKFKRLKTMDFGIVLDAHVYQREKHILKKVFNSSLIQVPNYEDAQTLFEKQEAKKSKITMTISGDKEKGSSEKEAKTKSKFEAVHDEVVKEVMEFDQTFYRPYPNTYFVNNLYVYPVEVAFNSQKIKVKSLFCRVYLLPSEVKNIDTDALQAVYAHNSNENYAKYFQTTVVFEDKNPSLFDEIKFQLPLTLTERHHLLFAFYTVDSKVLKPEKKGGQQQLETLIGFCWQPIYKDKRFLKDNEHTIAIEAPPASNNFVEYLDHMHKPIDAEKIYIRFRTRLSSSVYTHDEHLSNFFHQVHHRKTDHELMQPLSYINNVNDRILIQFSPTIINQLLVSMVKAKTDAAGNKIFLALLDVAARAFNLTMTSGKVSISEPLFAFISHHFDNTQNAHEVLARYWVGALKTSANVDPDVVLPPEATRTRELVFMSMKELSWFLFELTFKSMVLAIQAKGDLAKEETRKTRFTPAFKQSLKDLIKLSDTYRKKNATGFDFVSRNFGMFLTDLLRLHDRGHVLDLIGDYVLAIGTDNVQSNFRYRLLQLITDYEHYIPLNLPVETRIDTIDSIQLRFWKTHWLAGLYIHDLKQSLLSEDSKPSRSKALPRFRDLLWKHHLDDRYQSREIRSRIAGIYFPLLVIGVENIGAVIKTQSEKQGDTEIREWCLIMLWILQNCARDLHLRAWWSYESEQNILQLIQLLKLCVDTFAHDEAMKDETILIVTDVLDYFFDDFPQDLASEGSKIYEVVAQLVLHILRLSKPEYLIRDVLKIARSFIIKFRKPLFRYLTNYTFVSDLSYEIFNLCHSQTKKVVRDATTLLYLLLRTNSDEMGHFARMKLQSTLAISRLAKLDKCNFDELQAALDALSSYKDPKNTQASWQSQVRELVAKHGRVIRDSVRIAQFQDTFLDHKAELFYKICLEYVNSPDLRITWLNNLANYHEKRESFEEAAHSKVQIASLISEYLTQVLKPKVKGLPADSSRFARISPNIVNEKGLSVLWLEGSIISPDFSEDGFAKALSDAITLFIKVENWECAIESYLILNRFYNDNRKYQNLSTSAKDLATLSDKVYAANRAQSRIPPNFYRVGFYGEGFGEDNGKEFIYREPPSLRLADFTDNLTKRYEAQFGAANFELLKNIKPLEEMTLDPKKNYLQIVAVEIFYEFDELNARDLTYTDRSFNVKRFVFENPYVPDGGKPSEDPAKSWKRKNILTTRNAFPHILKRVEVAKKESKILAPVESAVDVIQSIVVRLKQCLNCTPPNIKTLQIILQGAILTQVNAGPLAILKVFLGNESAYPANFIDLLKDQFRAFLRSSQFGIRLNQSLIASQPEFAPLHEALTESFAKLRTEAAKYIEF